MSDNSTKTPRSGTSTAPLEPRVGQLDEIRAGREESTAILDAIGRLETEIHATRRESNARFSHLERRLDEVVSKTETNTRHIAEQADALTRVASAAAKAADLALEAKQQSARTPDDVAKLVESAMRIHEGSFGRAVDRAVETAIGPVVADVDALKRSTSAIVTELGIQNADENKITTLGKLEMRAKRSTIVQLIIALAAIVGALAQLVQHH